METASDRRARLGTTSKQERRVMRRKTSVTTIEHVSGYLEPEKHGSAEETSHSVSAGVGT